MAMDVTVGRWRVRLVAVRDAEIALNMRARVFRAGADDRDPFDAAARHLLIEGEGGLAACARVTVQDGSAILRGYTAQFYELSNFATRFPRALEVGRLCLAPDVRDPEVPRLLMSAVTRLVRATGRAVLYGCASFPASGAGLGRMARHVSPEPWMPRPRAGAAPLPPEPGPLPPLVRAYLALGAQVSDHAVRDADLDTLHVFTGLPVAAISPVRARRLAGLLDAV